MLREHVDSFLREGQPSEVFEGLVTILDKHGYAIEKKDTDKGVIVIRYLTLAVNMLLWRCWSDKVLVKTEASGHGKTRVDVYEIPNMFRIKVRKGEQVRNINELLGQLRESFR